MPPRKTWLACAWKLRDSQAKMQTEFASLRGEIAGLRRYMHSEIGKSENRLVKWIIGVMVTSTAAKIVAIVALTRLLEG